MENRDSELSKKISEEVKLQTPVREKMAVVISSTSDYAQIRHLILALNKTYDLFIFIYGPIAKTVLTDPLSKDTVNTRIVIPEDVITTKIILDDINMVVIPFMGLNFASKLSNFLLEDNALRFTFDALREMKKVMATDEQLKFEMKNFRLSRSVNTLRNELLSIGLAFSNIKELYRKFKFPFEQVKEEREEQVSTTTVTSSVKESVLRSEEGNRDQQSITNIPDNVSQILNSGADRIGTIFGINGNDIKPEVAKYIDHTLLKSDAAESDIIKLCDEAKEFHFATVCINPSFVKLAAEQLKGLDTEVATVIGFPLGASTTESKVFETRDAIKDGADEIDMVINIGALKSGNYELVQDDIRQVVKEAKGKPVKVIIETSALTDKEKVVASLIAKNAGAHFVKTSTGFGKGGATVEDILLIRKTIGPYMGIKASGGIRDYETAKQMIEAGATRIGASASVKIVS